MIISFLSIKAVQADDRFVVLRGFKHCTASATLEVPERSATIKTLFNSRLKS
ncbi:MAG: hypothetical protein ACM37W_05145 [Actinomycetota bacterium]